MQQPQSRELEGSPFAPPDGDSISTYYAVAVVRRAASDAFTIQELQGRKSCHSGYGSMAGWRIPVGLLLRKGLIQPGGCSSLLKGKHWSCALLLRMNPALLGVQRHSLVRGCW